MCVCVLALQKPRNTVHTLYTAAAPNLPTLINLNQESGAEACCSLGRVLQGGEAKLQEAGHMGWVPQGGNRGVRGTLALPGPEASSSSRR